MGVTLSIIPIPDDVKIGIDVIVKTFSKLNMITTFCMWSIKLP